MSTLVLTVARDTGPFYPKDEDSAKRLFGDLIEKTGATKILALRADSSNEIPPALAELAVNLGILCECVQVDKLEPEVWTDMDPKVLWGDHLETTILNSSISSNSSELSFMLNSGNGFGAGLLYSLYEMLGGSLWVTLGGVDRDYTAIEVDRNIPDEGSPGEAVLAGMARFNIENFGSAPTSSELQGLVDGIPAGKGIENTLRKYVEYFEDKKVARARIEKDLQIAIDKWEELKPDVEKSLKAAQKNADYKGERHWKGVKKTHEKRITHIKQGLKRLEWNLNSLGRYNANLTLAQQWSGLTVEGGRRGLVIFVRSVPQSKSVAKYLQEHRAALPFDRYAFVVGGIGISDEVEESKKVHEQTKQDLGDSTVVSSAEDSCYSIDPNGDLLDASSDVMEILHRIRQSNDAIGWSIDVTGVVGPLKPAIHQYAHLAKTPTFYIIKNPTEQTEDGVYVSGLTGPKHLLKLPEESHIHSTKAVLNDENLARFVATIYRFYQIHPNSSMGLEKKPYGDYRPYQFNRGNFPTDHPMRMEKIPERSTLKKNMDGRLKRALKYSMVERSGEKMKDIRLTPAGIVVGALLNG